MFSMSFWFVFFTWLLAISINQNVNALKTKVDQLQPPVTQADYVFPDPCGLTAVECPEEVSPIQVASASAGSKATWYNYSLPGYPNYGASNATAASRDLPRGSHARVTNLANGKSVEVVINDYVVEPTVAIDLSQYAFSQIADTKLGVIQVSIEQL